MWAALVAADPSTRTVASVVQHSTHVGQPRAWHEPGPQAWHPAPPEGLARAPLR